MYVINAYIHLRYSLRFSNTFSKVIPFVCVVTVRCYDYK